MVAQFAWHYTRRDIWQKIKRSGLLKSRNLLLSEKIRARPDWEQIKNDPKKIQALLPEGMGQTFSFLAYRPVVNFSLENFWEDQAGELSESRWDDSDDPSQLNKRGLELNKLPYAEKTLTMRATAELGGGLVRLGISPQIAAMHVVDARIGQGESSWCRGHEASIRY